MKSKFKNHPLNAQKLLLKDIPSNGRFYVPVEGYTRVPIAYTNVDGKLLWFSASHGIDSATDYHREVELAPEDFSVTLTH